MPTITDQLRAAIESSGLSQYALSRQAGVPQSQLSAFLSGKSLPSGATINRIAEVLGLDLRQKKIGKINRKTD